MPARCATRDAASRSAIESRPPESATPTWPPSGSACARRSATARPTPSCARSSAGRDLLESTISEDLVFACLEQGLDRVLLQLAQRFGQRLLQRDHHRGMIAMRAAGGLVHDLVDQPELLQPPGRDAERF